jgi:hypothetical protein
VGGLRALDPARLVLVRDGMQSWLILPHDNAGQTVASPDYTFTMRDGERWQEGLRQLESLQHPVLVTGIGVELLASDNRTDLRGNSVERDDALNFLRGIIESLRRSEAGLYCAKS